MSKRDFLLEIGVEELPARFIPDAIEQLREKLEEWFQKERISYDNVSTFATPRRLAVLVEGVAEKQEDIREEARGPAKKIAIDDEGNWTKAALGFARGQGVDVNDLYVKEVKGVDYVFANKFIAGKASAERLRDIKEVIANLQFPQTMRWGSYSFRFARPIRWLVALYGDEVIPFSINDVETGAKTYGHRFLGKEVTLKKPTDYLETLKREYVIADYDERKALIRQQIETLAKENGWVVPIDEALLDEVTNLVEYPTALYGTFDASFLTLPKEVLITSMREHQRYFPVEDKEKKLLPYFITVRNGNRDHLDRVAKGNEKVLRARLADAAFFYEEDQKLSIDAALKQLEQIVYHEQLGSVGDKVRRIVAIVTKLSDTLAIAEETKAIAIRAAEICKFDLVTQMVNEFTELQGYMGEVYAKLAGEKAEVARAIEEHYKPRFAGDATPTSLPGKLVSIADKLDTIITCFSIGLIPTGSQDPYALRRQAAGIVQMLADDDIAMDVEQLIQLGISICKEQLSFKRAVAEVEKDLGEFFNIRVKAFLQDKGVPFDVIDAVISDRLGRVPAAYKKAMFIVEKRNDETFKKAIEALSRVTNIAKKAEKVTRVDEDLFEKEEERALYLKYIEVKERTKSALQAGKIDEAFAALASMTDIINNYFDHIMVMADDERIRENRLAQMRELAEVIRSFANFQALVIQSA